MGVQRLKPSSSSPAYRIKSAPTTGQKVLPDRTGVNVVCSASTNFGAWAQLVATAPYDLVIVGIVLNPDSSSAFSAHVEVGVGAAGGEVGIGEVVVQNYPSTGGVSLFFVDFPFPINVLAGTRIAVRGANSDSAGRTFIGVKAVVVRASDLEAF